MVYAERGEAPVREQTGGGPGVRTLLCRVDQSQLPDDAVVSAFFADDSLTRQDQPGEVFIRDYETIGRVKDQWQQVQDLVNELCDCPEHGGDH